MPQGDGSEVKPPNCRRCLHVRSLLGSEHKSCAHPDIAAVAESPLGKILSVMGSRVPSAHGTLPLGVVGNEHAIRHGWFNWPFNFDPLWLKSCDGFEKTETTDEPPV